MTLDDLLRGDESEVSEWLRGEDLLHECDCGYTVYDPDDVNSAVQETWGDAPCDEIFEWACGLADRFGWLFVESAQSELGIYHCQHCKESEWSLLMDMEKIVSTPISETSSSESTASPATPQAPKANERLVVYIDESYSDEFPRRQDGSLAYAALVIPESQVENLESRVAQILSESYRGRPASELKYSKLSKHPGLLERVGSRVVKLLSEMPESRVIGVFVPRAGYFGEKTRSIIAVSHYKGSEPNEDELRRVESTTSVEAAVRNVPNNLAHLIASCVSSFVGYHAAFAKIVFDPRSKQLDEALVAELETFVPRIPVNVPLIRHGDAIVTSWPTADSERVGNRVSYEYLRSSHESPGLQLADFVAGDIRTFFNEVPDLLDAATTTSPLVNRRVLFPETFRVGRIGREILAKVHKRTGRSFLPQYRDRLVNRLISHYTRNGQMRNLDTETGEVFDLMD
jgi:Protein of unknown function (DUF3800)